MNARPLIGVTTQTLQAIDDIPEGLPPSWVMNQRYVTAITSVNAVPVLIPLLQDETALRGIYESLDGVLIPGGVDMDPESYGEGTDESCGRIDPPRDRVELQFARWAMEDDKPLLGICRGMQVMNVAAGGTLWQDCTLFYPGSLKHDYFPNAGYARDYLAHTARLEGGSRLEAIFETAEIQVNSMHHQGIREVGEGLRPTAWAPDGLIEALEADDRAFAVAVQWHPEMLVDSDPGTRRLFSAFVDAASAYRLTRRLDLVG